MNIQDQPIEFFIRTMPETVKEENKRPKKQQGQHDISMSLENAFASANYGSMPSELKSIKPEIFKKLMTATKNKIKTVVEEMAELEEIQNVKAIELEFGVGFTQKLGVSIFELGGNQSLKVKVIIEK